MVKRWELKEKNDRAILGGKRTPGSGNKWSAPGDIKSGDFLVECKDTEKKSYSISKARWTKIANEALFSYRLPMMSIRIQELDLVVVAREDWLRILGKK